MSARAEWLCPCHFAKTLERPTPPETELVLLSSVNHFVFKLWPEWEGSPSVPMVSARGHYRSCLSLCLVPVLAPETGCIPV